MEEEKTGFGGKPMELHEMTRDEIEEQEAKTRWEMKSMADSLSGMVGQLHILEHFADDKSWPGAKWLTEACLELANVAGLYRSLSKSGKGDGEETGEVAK